MLYSSESQKKKNFLSVGLAWLDAVPQVYGPWFDPELKLKSLWDSHVLSVSSRNSFWFPPLSKNETIMVTLCTQYFWDKLQIHHNPYRIQKKLKINVPSMDNYGL